MRRQIVTGTQQSKPVRRGHYLKTAVQAWPAESIRELCLFLCEQRRYGQLCRHGRLRASVSCASSCVNSAGIDGTPAVAVLVHLPLRKVAEH
eukprot:357386-Chlamydomonas_euryale.AAC.6